MHPVNPKKPYKFEPLGQQYMHKFNYFFGVVPVCLNYLTRMLNLHILFTTRYLVDIGLYFNKNY